MKKSRKQRSKSSPSAALAALLRIVNLAPMKTEFPSAEDLKNRYEETTGKSITSSSMFEDNDYFWWLDTEIRNICRPYPDLLAHIDFDNTSRDDDGSHVDISSDYFQFLLARRDLKSMIEYSRGQENWVMTDSTLPSNFFIHVKVQDGKFIFEMTPFASALQNIDIHRLSICLHCEAIFWADRVDKRCCSKPCGEALRMREYRARKKARLRTAALEAERKQRARHEWNARNFS